VLERKYYFDDLYIKGFAAGGRKIGQFLWEKGDELIIDDILVNGTANSIAKFATVLRRIQTGYLYHYAFAMFIGMTVILAWLLWA
jgi:NADH-quinone oxidoreductase subunit L